MNRTAAVLPSDAQTEFLGIAYRVVAIAAFSINDAIVKLLTEGFPVTQVVFCRALFAFLPLSVALLWRSQRLSLATRRPLVHLARSACGLVAVFSFFHAVKYLPLVDAYVLFFTGPLWITALSVPLLGEEVGWRRWLAVLVGFAGVFIMLQPGSGVVSWPALLGLLAAVGYALSAIIVRRNAVTETSFAFTFYFTLAVAMASAVIGSHGGDWHIPQGIDLFLLVSIGLVGGTAQLILTESFRLAPASVVAPFEYTGMIWAVGLGWLMFGDLPTLPVWLGIALVTGAGLYIIHRETIRKRVAYARPAETATAAPRPPRLPEDWSNR